MRIFKDLGMVEYLRSGVPRILQSYGKECFRFTDNFLPMTLPNAVTQYTKNGGSIQLTTKQKEILSLIEKDTQISKIQLAQFLKINHSAVDKHIESLKSKGCFKTNRRYKRILASESARIIYLFKKGSDILMGITNELSLRSPLNDNLSPFYLKK